MYLAGLRPLVERAVETGDLRKGADVDALLSLLLVLLPHLALAAHTLGLEGPVRLAGEHPEVRRANIARLIGPVLADFVPKGP
jgi:hypothetical protein